MTTAIPLLLLPGSLCDKRLFEPQISHFSASRIVTVGDFSGCNTIQAMAVKILSKAPPRFALLGLSMGGIVALEIYRQAPHRVDRLALLNTNPHPQHTESIAIRLQQMADIRIAGRAAMKALVEESFFPRYVARSRLDDRWLKFLVLEMASSAGLAAFDDQWSALINRPDSYDTLLLIDCPTLVLCGDEDQMCSPDIHREMAHLIKTAELKIIEDCGHLSTLEAPTAVNIALQRWLNIER